MAKCPELDYYSRSWANLREALQSELQALRESNEDSGKTLEETNFLRGKIWQIKHILKWEQAAFEQESRSKLL